MYKWECLVCGFFYDEALGRPEDGIAAGTRWEDVPQDWYCPECGVGKADFEMVRLPLKAEVPQAAAPSEPVVILGSGLAGYTVARELRKLDAVTPIMIVTRDGGEFYSKPALSNACQSGRLPDQLVTSDAAHMAVQLNATIITHTQVERIDVDAQCIYLAGKAQRYGALVLALGADPRRPSLKGDGADALITVNDLDDYRHLHQQIGQASRIAILGGGLIGCEFANDLCHAGHEIIIVDRATWPLSRLLPEQAGEEMANALHAIGVRLELGNGPVAVHRSANGLELQLADERVLEVDYVLSAIGLQPRVELARTAGLTVEAGIVTDAHLRTSASNVYALGDCAQVHGLLLPYVMPIMLQARALAQTLAGQPTAVAYPAMPVTIKTSVLPTVVASPLDDQGLWSTELLSRCDKGIAAVRSLYHDRDSRVQGFVLMGAATQQKAELLSALPAWR
ncbi:FAD-dependent oxidoreductase [Pseudomonas sp. KU43P]|uniref:FAD-dependent oxidoreductase n=1 Tax=Pseudomonas sp. KU43P TaxID=2487887 RepID=UPI0012AA161C|nr:FAD-dependent oxidoreductase [Pseudomonas sp. KU43P]BBH46317.1 pyridine nucleotide-disulfide oxidoreductase [Pseudomonas sp. KU43P]